MYRATDGNRLCSEEESGAYRVPAPRGERSKQLICIARAPRGCAPPSFGEAADVPLRKSMVAP